MVGGDSLASVPGSTAGTYPATEPPYKVCDESLLTKSLNFGDCTSTSVLSTCGVNSGFYITPRRGASLVTAFRLCTANDIPTRDPTSITLEGSNQNAADLDLGSSWTLIYQGVSGLSVDPGRSTCGDKMFFSNTITFTSYRFLVVGKRGAENSFQLSELQFFGV